MSNNSCFVLAAGAATVGLFSLAGYLFVPSVGAVTGAALGGGTYLLAIPLAGCAWHEGSKCRDGERSYAEVGFVVGLFVSVCLAYLVCNAINSLKPITFGSALITAGHAAWMALALIILIVGIHRCNERRYI